MDFTLWLRHFESSRLHRPEPHWHQPCSEDPATAAELARSLSHFQLGESGEGTFLLTEAQRSYPDDPHYVDALALFVAEEQEHARLLERLVARFGGTLISKHWTHRCFCLHGELSASSSRSRPWSSPSSSAWRTTGSCAPGRRTLC